MNNIEADLREALRRKQPSEGFVERVAEAAAMSRRPWHWQPSIAAVVASCLFLGVGGAYWQRERQAERAREQLILALRITGQELMRVEELAAKNLKKQER